jgi:trichothecene efflux pump TRI12
MLLIYGATIKLISDAVMTTLTPNTFPLALGMGFLAMFGMGMSLVALVVCVQLASEDSHIGLATLVLGSIRAIGGSVAVTIYSSLMQNTVKKDAPTRVGKAVIPLGVSRETLHSLVPLLVGGKIEQAGHVPGVSSQALKAGLDALKWTYTLVFQ